MKNKGFTLIELMITLAFAGIIGAIVISVATEFEIDIPHSLIQNGTFCESGLLWSASQGYRTQVIGSNGLPLTCNK